MYKPGEIGNASSERDELAQKIKALTENNQRAKEALRREELEQQFQQRIMKCTHATQIEIKNSLIANYQDIIDEQEARIFHLESHINGIQSLSPRASQPLGGVTRLKSAIDDLTTKVIESNEALMKERFSNQVLETELERYRQQVQDMQLPSICCSPSDIFTNGHSNSETSTHQIELENVKTALKSWQEKYEALKLDFDRMDLRYSEQLLQLEERERQTLERLHSETKRFQNQIENMRNHIDRYTKNETNNDKTSENGCSSQKALIDSEKENHSSFVKLNGCNGDDAQPFSQLQSLHSTIGCLEKEVEKKTLELEQVRAEAKKEANQLKNSVVRVRRQSQLWEQRHADAIIALDCFRATLRSLREEQTDLKKTAIQMQTQIKAKVNELTGQLCQHVMPIISDLSQRYRNEALQRKNLHDELVELRGNIRVFCRVRPMLTFDSDQTSLVEVDPEDNTLLFVSNNGKRQTFNLDRVFGPRHEQPEIFADVRPLIISVLDGYNVCIFAYGQTGSGKTYTMEGVSENPGINQRALAALFEESTSGRSDWTFEIEVSMLEIYNETIRDLLCKDGEQEKLDIKMNTDGNLHVPGLQRVKVTGLSDVNEVLRIGRENRMTASTNINERSSRSHALLCVYINGCNRTTGVTTQGRLNLVDLAGSERVSKSAASGDRLKEAQCINKSLSALGDVICALRNHRQHVPFRNSKLTYFLQDSLAGNSKTLMVVQVAPSARHVSESVCSLNFAQRVHSVKLGQATPMKTLTFSNGNGHESNGEEKITRSPFVRVPSSRFRSSQRV